jgi:hypothetical protein
MYIAADDLLTVSRRFRAFLEILDNQWILKHAKIRRFCPF